jgi:hypothetical protein
MFLHMKIMPKWPVFWSEEGESGGVDISCHLAAAAAVVVVTVVVVHW